MNAKSAKYPRRFRNRFWFHGARWKGEATNIVNTRTTDPTTNGGTECQVPLYVAFNNHKDEFVSQKTVYRGYLRPFRRFKGNLWHEAPYFGIAHWPKHPKATLYRDMATNAKGYWRLRSRAGFYVFTVIWRGVHRFLACKTRSIRHQRLPCQLWN